MDVDSCSVSLPEDLPIFPGTAGLIDKLNALVKVSRRREFFMKGEDVLGGVLPEALPILYNLLLIKGLIPPRTFLLAL